MDTYLSHAPGLPGSAVAVVGPVGGASAWDAVAVVGVLLLVLLNGLFVAAETNLVRSRSHGHDGAASRGGQTGRRARRLDRQRAGRLAAARMGITLASLGLGGLGAPAIGRLVAPLVVPLGLAARSVEVAFGLASVAFLLIVFGDMAPRAIATRRPEAAARLVSGPLAAFETLFRFPLRFAAGAAALALRPFGIRPTDERVTALDADGNGKDHLSPEPGDAAEAVAAGLPPTAVAIGDRNARDVMVPRVDVAYLSTAWTLEENIRRVHETGFTRFPLCDPDADHVIGMVHIKDLLMLVSRPGSAILEARREVLVVPGARPLDSLLREFQSSRIHLAVVLDEYGGTAGIVTLEDVLEEIVGEIQDEHHDDRTDVERVGDGAIRVSGGLTLADLERALGIELPDEEVDTVGGYMQWRLGAVPAVGQEVEADGCTLKVEAMEGLRVRAILITRSAVPDPLALGATEG